MARKQSTGLRLEHLAGGLLVLFLTYLVRQVLQDLAQQIVQQVVDSRNRQRY